MGAGVGYQNYGSNGKFRVPEAQYIAVDMQPSQAQIYINTPQTPEMSSQVLSERLSALQESNVQLRGLIDRLATIQFQPGSVPLDSEDGNVMDELTAEIQQTLKDQDEDLELLQEEVYDLEPGRPGSDLEQQKATINEAVKRALEELKACQTSFRKAQLSARRNLQAAQRAERELLLQSYLDPTPSSPSSPVPGQRRRMQQSAELSNDEKTVNASSDVTLALRRTHEMMANELSRSQFAHDTLKESTAALAQLSETYSTLDTLLSSSRNLLGTLLRSQKSDTWYLETAFYVLLTTIAWLVFRRFLYGPMWWLVWLPLKMFLKGGMGIFAALGLRGGASVEGVSSSIVGFETTVYGSTMSASSAFVGGGGSGAPMSSTVVTHSAQAQESGDSVSEEVGRIIDDSRNEQTTDERSGQGAVEDEQTDPEKNPKKRMWEEDKEAAEAARRKKDEL